MQDLSKIYQFIQDIEPLKDTLRTGITQQGRMESVAEHSWRLATMAIIVCPNYFPSLDLKKVLEMCLIHDLGEIINGDIPAPMQALIPDKSEQERKDFLKIIEPLPTAIADDLLTVWEEYEAASSPESKLVKALDKLETIIQHNQGNKAPDFDHAFDLTYGSAYMKMDPFITELRKLVDEDTQSAMGQ